MSETKIKPVSPHLKELAGRLSSLSYSDMSEFVKGVITATGSGLGEGYLAEKILEWSEETSERPAKGKPEKKPELLYRARP